MALVKPAESTSGVTGEYWRVISFGLTQHMEPGIKNIRVTACLYLDQAARFDNKSPLDMQEFSFLESSPITDPPLTYAYNKVKALDQFQGSVDA
jgi:hypothetical protein